MDYTIHLVLLIFLTKCIAVNIRRLEVPALVRLGRQAAVLDCDYTLGPDPRGLVIKWFFNNKSNQVYQWIPPFRPQDLGLLKGKIDLDFRISDEPLLAHRALRIISPSTEMSGNYTCVVSTFEAEDHQSKGMLVFSPGHNFQFVQEKKYVFLVTLICFVEDVYPRPVITIRSRGEPLKDVKLQTEMDAHGLYDMVASAVVHDDDVPDERAQFVCELSLPPANYTVTRNTLYYPGLMPTAQLAAVESAEKSLDHHSSNGNSAVSASSITHALYVIAIFYSLSARLN